MKRGFIRGIKRLQAVDQLAFLETAGVTTIYENDVNEAIASLRQGDELALGGGLQILADNRQSIRELVDRVHAIGATVVDIATDQNTGRDGVAMLDEAVVNIAVAKFGNVKDAGTLGSKVRWAEAQLSRMDEDEARKIWHDKSLTREEALARMTGWTDGTARRLLGKPDRPAGRRKGKKPPKGRGRVYFARNGQSKRIKIGHSVKPISRLRNMQTSNDCKLELLLVIPGTRALEKRLQKKFEHCRERGEWFNPCDELMEFIAAKAAEK